MKKTKVFKCDEQSLIDLICDPQFIVDRAIALGSLDASCESEGDDENFTLTICQTKKVNAPKALKKFTGDTQDVTATENWRIGDEVISCTAQIAIDGAPLKISFNTKIIGDDDQCTLTTEFKFKSNIPLVGKMMESFASSEAEKELLAEWQYIEDQLKK